VLEAQEQWRSSRIEKEVASLRAAGPWDTIVATEVVQAATREVRSQLILTKRRARGCWNHEGTDWKPHVPLNKHGRQTAETMEF